MAANKLIGRIKRTTLTGKGFDATLSDLMRMTLTGEISLRDAERVRQSARKHLRTLKARKFAIDRTT